MVTFDLGGSNGNSGQPGTRGCRLILEQTVEMHFSQIYIPSTIRELPRKKHLEPLLILPLPSVLFLLLSYYLITARALPDIPNVLLCSGDFCLVLSAVHNVHNFREAIDIGLMNYVINQFRE